MNITENLDRIEAAVNSLKTDVARLDGGNVSNIDEAVAFVGTLQSEAVAAPTFVEYDGSTESAIWLYEYRPIVTMQFIDIVEGTLGIGIGYSGVGPWPILTIEDGHLNYYLYHYSSLNDPIILTDPELLDNEQHVWEFGLNYLSKDGVVVASTSESGYQTASFILFRSGETFSSPWSGKARIFSVAFNPSNRRIEYLPKSFDSSSKARLINMSYYNGWNNPNLMNSIYYVTYDARDSSTSGPAEYSSYRNEFATADLYIDASTSQQVFDASNDGYYAYSSVTARPVDASIDPNIQAGNIKSGVTILGVQGSYEGSGGTGDLQEKNISIDLDTVDSSINPDSGYDGLSKVVIDSSTLNSQRTEIYNRLLGISGSTIINYVLNETQAQTILTELEGI
jgi:hypothetical protein